jgi:hypothetical protein
MHGETRVIHFPDSLNKVAKDRQAGMPVLLRCQKN